MHELNIFGQRLAQGLGHCLGPTIGNEATTDLGFDLFLELIDAAVVFVFLEALFQRGELAANFLTTRLHQLFEHAFEIEITKRAIQVIGATHWAARLHASKTLH
ncbi:unannotated protein [freshwater metagenome]|uniref:Unannotated protein n=1 Tax=freshwater metagenome TaxID=449393 RepID=A0A6J6YJH1_9ZZZZ